MMDLTNGVLTRMTLDSQSSIFPGPWSPDSQRIAVNRQNGGPAEVTVASGKLRVLATDLHYANDWWPDGNSLLLIDETGHRLSQLPLTGDTTARTILDTRHSQRYYRFSPDGRWVSYSSDESGRYEVFVAAFPSFAEKRQVSNGGGGMSFWRKDGKEILYVGPPNTLMSAEIQTGSHIEAGVPKPLFQFPRLAFPDFGIAPAADGKRFLVIEGDQPSQQAPITVVVNWAVELQGQ
jgi:Tol biopolymer transport system component